MHGSKAEAYAPDVPRHPHSAVLMHELRGLYHLTTTAFRHLSLPHAMNTYEDAPNPFSTDPSPPGTPRHEHASTRSLEGTPTAPQSPLPSHEALEASRGGSKDGSVVSAASGSPPPTYRAGFPEAGVKSYVGPKVKEGNCCERDAELQAGVEISVCPLEGDVMGAYCSWDRSWMR
jgi:hypothetical protein